MSNDRISFDISAEDVEGRSFEPAPAGWYDVVIDNVDEQESKSAANPGKPMYVMYFKSTDDKFKGTQRTYACLWYEARFAIVDIMKATGFKVEPGTLSIPDSDDFIGKELQIKLAIESYTTNDGEDAKRNAVKVFRSLEAAKTASKGKAAASAPKSKAKAKADTGGFAL